MIHKKEDIQNKGRKRKIITYTVPLSIRDIDEDPIKLKNDPNELTKENIKNKAFEYHSKGDLITAEKYYKQFIDRGYKDPLIFGNYAIILNQKK